MKIALKTYSILLFSGVFLIGQEKGDLDLDGLVNVIDIVQTVSIILEQDTSISEYEFWAADVNRDNSVSVLDIVLIVNIIYGLYQSFPGGYLDSPYVVPDGSAIYFLHSPISFIDMLTGNFEAEPITDFLPGHHGQDGYFWWNSDLYVSYKNQNGTWSAPYNLSSEINTPDGLECCPWVNSDQTEIIFSRPHFTDSTLHGSYISRRDSSESQWGTPVRLHGELGEMVDDGYHNYHLCPSGNMYFERGGTDRILYWARSIGPDQWASPEIMPANLQSEIEDTQPWVSDDELNLYYNRRGTDGVSILMHSTRSDTAMEWSDPVEVPLIDFKDENGSIIWGEPSFSADGNMYYVRMSTLYPSYKPELMMAPLNPDGSYGPPVKLFFYY